MERISKVRHREAEIGYEAESLLVLEIALLNTANGYTHVHTYTYTHSYHTHTHTYSTQTHSYTHHTIHRHT